MKIKNFNLKKSKKSMMIAEEVLRIVLAVACIFLLVYISAKLYSIFIAKGDLDKARAELDNINGIINLGLQDTSANVIVGRDYLLMTPQEWVLTGWPYGNIYPEYCASRGWKKCLCMCDVHQGIIGKILLNAARPDKIAESCTKNQICIEITADILMVNPSDNWWITNWGASDLRPIYVKKLNEDYNGLFNIIYDKSANKLSIIPFKK